MVRGKGVCVMFKGFAGLALVVALSGCSGLGSRWAQTCQSWGLEYGTPDYANCMASQQARFDRNMQDSLHNLGTAGMMMSQPSLVPGGPMVPGAGW